MFWQVFGIGVAGAIALFGVWLLMRKLIGWLDERRGFLDMGTPGEASLFVIIGLVLILFIAGVVAATGENKGRCGPGTRMVVDRVWTGKGYVTDEICVVDPEFAPEG